MMKEFKPVAIIIGTTMTLTFVIGICCIIGSDIPSIIGTTVLIIMTETTEWLNRKLFTIIGYEVVYDEVVKIYKGRWYGPVLVRAGELWTVLIVMGIHRPWQLYFGWSCVIWPIVMGCVLVISFFRLRKDGLI